MARVKGEDTNQRGARLIVSNEEILKVIPLKNTKY